MDKFEMRKIDYGTPEYEETVDFRDHYFRKPQGLNIRDDDLSSDKNSVIYGGYIGDKLVATIYYLEKDPETATIKAVITDDSIRGQGYGRYIMEFAEEKIRNEGYKKIYLEARTSAEDFYKKLGYETKSGIYNIHLIPHVDMEKNL